jgi:hypothetical protein
LSTEDVLSKELYNAGIKCKLKCKKLFISDELLKFKEVVFAKFFAENYLFETLVLVNLYRRIKACVF